ncbi:MAG: hypothetical protein E7K68_03830 [Corynebacterium kroppenstedtii]|nr:hypothetical protein [Corynebacterium kroppenstedtii]
MLANISFFWDSPLPKRRLILPIALRGDIFMYWKKKLAILLSSSISLVSVPAVSASAAPTSQEQGCVAAHQGVSASNADRQTVSKDDLAQLNKNIELAGGYPLPEGTVE